MMEDLIQKAFLEDIPHKDLTTTSLKTKDKFGCAQLIAKQDLVLSGSPLFEASLHHLDPGLEVSWQFKPGDEVLDRQILAQISGNLISLIQAERVALNFLGLLSGIATQTSHFVKACAGTQARILDTRKTIPLYRAFSKQAVIDGGGHNHRMNLSDAILIKENHIAIAGGFRECIKQIRSQSDQPIEVETKNIHEVQEAVELKVSRIMLDNMSLQEMSRCLELIPESIETEASGNMTLDRIPDVAALGVDFISVGALTHSAKNADFSLIFDWN
jgi:nicotinate-nucleotide pyrophosphorylase (carboxylating)